MTCLIQKTFNREDIIIPHDYKNMNYNVYLFKKGDVEIYKRICRRCGFVNHCKY